MRRTFPSRTVPYTKTKLLSPVVMEYLLSGILGLQVAHGDPNGERTSFYVVTPHFSLFQLTLYSTQPQS